MNAAAELLDPSISGLEKSIGQQARYGRTILIASGVRRAGLGVAGVVTAKNEGDCLGHPSTPFSTSREDSPAFGAAVATLLLL